MIIKILLIVVCGLAIAAYAVEHRMLKEADKKVLMYRNISDEYAAKMEELRGRLEEKEKEEKNNYKVIKVRQECVDMRPVQCRVLVPRELEDKKEEYTAAIAKDMLWDYAKEVAYKKEEQDWQNCATAVTFQWFMNCRGDNLERDSFL